MKTKVWKRIGALVLVLALILSGLPQMCIEALAETTGSEFSITGLSQGAERVVNNTYWYIHLRHDGGFNIGDTDSFCTEYVSWNATIDNGAGEKNISLTLYDSGTDTIRLQVYQATIPTDGTANCKVTLKAGTCTSSTGNYSNTLREDVVLYFNEYGISLDEPIPDVESNDVYAKSVWVHAACDRAAIYWDMTASDIFADSAKLLAANGLVEGKWYYPNETSGIWIDDQYYEPDPNHVNPGFVKFRASTNSYYITLWNVQNDFSAGSKLALEGRFIVGDQAVYMDKSVFQWVVPTGVEDSRETGRWVILPRLLELAEGTTTENGVWEIHMSYLGELLGNDGETFTAKAVVGNEEIEVTISTDGTNIIITPPADKVPTDGSEVTMTLKAGDITGSAGSTSMIVNDVTFCINEYGLSLDEYITVDTEDVALSYYHVQAQPNYVYMRGLIDDVFPATNSAGDLSWDIYPEPLNGIVDGVYYHEGNSGIWVDDTYYDKNGNGVGVGFVKHGMTGQPLRDYYLSSPGVEGVEKQVTVQGLFRWTDDSGKTYMVEYLPSTLKWDGSEWTDASSYTVLQKELDAKTSYEDGTWNIYMNHNGGFKGVTEENAAERFVWPATIGGVETTIDVYATPNGDTYYFNPVIPDADTLKPESGNVELVIKAATVTGSNGTENQLIADVTLYFNKYGLSIDGSTAELGTPTEDVKLGLTEPISWDTGIYFKSSKADGIVGDSSWAVRPVALGGYIDGVCYRGDGGVFITDANGVTTKYAPNSKVTGVPSFVKIGNYGSNSMIYYLGINKSQTVETGTKVEIKGLFEWDGQLVDFSSTVLQWNGSEWINVTPAHDTDVELTLREDSGTSERIYLNGVDGFDPSVTAFIDPMPGEENGVFLNGVRTGVQIYKMGTPNEASVYHVLLDGQDIEAQVGDEVVIKGRFTSNCYIVEYKEAMWVFDGSKWVASNLPTKVTPADTSEGDSENSLGFTVSPEDALTVDAVNAYAFAEGGIYINGIFNTAAQLYKVGTNLYKVDLSTCGMTFEEGNTVTVDGTVESSDVKVEYLRTVFTYEGNGVWTLTESGIPKEPVRFELDADASYKAENGDWKLIFKATDGLRGDPGIAADATYSGLTAIIAESTEYAPSFFKNSKSYYEVTIPNGALPSTGGVYEIVIKRGTITGGWEAEAGRYMQKEIILYVNGDRISDKGTPTGTADVTLTYSSGNSSELNLLLNGEDAMIVTTKNGGTIYAENEPNSGVFINGIKQENLGIFKFEQSSSQYYYVPFSGINYTPVSGDVVVVNGTFELANYYVTFNTVAMKWDGSAWSSISDLSSITLNKATCDASDSAYIIDTEGTTVDGAVVDSGTVLYKEGEYQVVYTIGAATMTQTLDVVYTFTSANNNGAGKADTALPNMVTGKANAAGQYITDVKATTHGTTVISMDKDNSYKTSADFDDYGLDYVIDINMDSDREFKVLQIADTQTIDSEQQRYDGRISATLAAQTVAEKQYENMQYYIETVVEQSQPDVILIAGDIIYTEFDDDGSMWLDLIEYMDSLQIPWAPIFGNHDNESMMGVEWQCQQLMNSTYCLFNQRHEGIGGNGNYSIGLARNGELEKAIYMLDSNGCGNVAKSGNTYSTWGFDEAGNMTQIRAASGFYQTQIEWYGTTAKRVNAVAGKIIPSIQCYHIGTEEVLLAARAAGYQYGEDSAALKYGMSNDPESESYVEAGKVSYTVKPQTGDSGYKMGVFSDLHRANGMLEIMNEVGTTGVFTGHNHTINTSMTYGGVRWTYGLKTGIYADDTVNKGGTLITLDLEGFDFTIEQIQVELEYSAPTLDGDKAADNAANIIYLNGNAIRDAIPAQTEALVVANDEECGIFVNAMKSDATVEKYADDKYKVTLSKEAEMGDVVSVYGIFENATGSHAVYFQKTLVVQWDGTQWNAITVDTLNGSTVSVNAIGVNYEEIQNYLLAGTGILPTHIDASGNKTQIEAISTYGDNILKCILDKITYEKVIALYIPGDSHVDQELNVLDLVAMKKAEKGEEAESETESYADQLGSEELRRKLVGK